MPGLKFFLLGDVLGADSKVECNSVFPELFLLRVFNFRSLVITIGQDGRL